MPQYSNAPKSLFDIILEVLSEHTDSNLSSSAAKEKIADDICIKYYDYINPKVDEEPIDSIYDVISADDFLDTDNEDF